MAMTIEKLKEIMKETFDTGENEYLFRLEELEHERRDGFIPFIDGGYRVVKLFNLSTFHGSGYRFYVKEADAKIEEFINYNYELAKDRFVDNYPDYKGKDFNYTSLYEEGKGELAEELSNMESDYMSDDDIMVEFGFHFYNEGNTHSDKPNSDSIYIYAIINWETPYFRSGADNEKLLFQKTVSLKHSEKSFRKLAKKANEIFSRIKE
ncbi:MAG: hypothetical protein BWY74_00321 [Firmicutes bacterium ADurb.Bin419]|nr:MAG: hypothetical protein BWY74_00321 [Firmicutes bacterium ADurb.Bin419]